MKTKVIKLHEQERDRKVSESGIKEINLQISNIT